MPALTIKRNDRAAFVGQTGSGKTYAAGLFTSTIDRLVVFDPKNAEALKRWDLDDWGPFGSVKLNNAKRFRLRIGMQEDAADWGPYLDMIWRAGNVTLYVDELYHVTNFGRYHHKGLAKIYTAGRERKIGCYACMQRPVWTPRYSRSECEWFFCFRLLDRDDKITMKHFIGVMPEVPAKHPHGLWLFNNSWQGPVYHSKLVAVNAQGEAVSV